MCTETKERPIIFNAEMVRAILDGRKTQTRRVIKPKPPRWCDSLVWLRGILKWRAHHPSSGAVPSPARPEWRCPYGQPGDLLWVRETARGRCYGGKKGKKPDWIELLYRADEAMVQFDRDGFGAYKLTGRWTPSIFMPRWASRIALEITGVRVERVQDISPNDARAEGVPAPESAIAMAHPDDYALHRFKHLWDSINAKRGFGWDVNPWVWVIEFQHP